jgi:hypothetical protein
MARRAEAMDVDLPAVATAPAINGSSTPLPNANGSIRARSIPLIPDHYTVGYVYSEQMMLHNKHPLIEQDNDPHPEQPARIAEVHRLFEANSLVKHMKRINIRAVRQDEVLLVHSRQLWNDVQRLAGKFSSRAAHALA